MYFPVLLAAGFVLNCAKMESLIGDFKVAEGRIILILALKALAVALVAGDCSGSSGSWLLLW